MTRLAIIDHAQHELYIEDVPDEVLEKYHGEEEAYILDNYEFEDGFSWEYIIDSYYLSKEGDPARIHFENTLD